MWKGRRREHWYHTAKIAYLLAETNRNEEMKPEPFREWEFHPMGRAVYRKAKRSQRTAPPPTEAELEALRKAFPTKGK